MVCSGVLDHVEATVFVILYCVHERSVPLVVLTALLMLLRVQMHFVHRMSHLMRVLPAGAGFAGGVIGRPEW